MACNLPPSFRNLLVRLFRADVYRRTGFVEFPPQADFRLATEGYELTEQIVDPPDREPPPFDINKVRLEDYPIVPKPVKLQVPCLKTDIGAYQAGEKGNYAKIQWQLAVPRVVLVPMEDGPQMVSGFVARNASLLASFKMGKSKTIGMWSTGFACLPGATVDMVGLEYGTSEHEFSYLCESLLGGTKPIVRKPVHHYDDVRGGRMFLELPNGMSYGVRSYKNKDALRGGQITCYIFNEIYMLPGFDVYTGHAQNLEVEHGFSAFTSTPDKPWVKVLHQLGHGRDPEWHCVCDNNAYVNPYYFNLTRFMRDAPDWETIKEFAPLLYPMCKKSGMEPGRLMSKEKFMISWLGRIGGFVGRVYSFQKDAITCTPHSHPRMWKPEIVASWQNDKAQLAALKEAARALT